MTDSSRPMMSQTSQQTSETMWQHQQRSLQELLRHVWKHSSFYRDYYESHGIREKDLPEISICDLPFLSKQILMENFDRAVTDRRLKKKEIEDWFQNHRDPREAFSRDFVVLHGSGSSGELGIFVHDRKSWQLADAVVAGCLPAPENYPSGKTRAAFYLASHGHFAGVSTATSIPESVYETLIVSLLEPREQAVNRLNAFQPHRLYGYSSSVSELAELATQGALNIRPERIFVSGDRLTEGMRETIRKTWKAPIYELYAASESKYIAVKGPAQDHLAIVEELNIVEVLDKRDWRVPPGKVGRVVLTNLYNYALPILRYELGDYVVRGPQDSESFCASISRIRGRVNDALPIVLADGSPDEIHPIVLTTFYAPGLERVQFISVRPEHVGIHYTAPRNIDRAVREEFERMLATRGAARTTFEVRRVREIANDPETGKLRLVKIEHDETRPPSRPGLDEATPGRGWRVEPEEVEAIPRSRPALRAVVSEAKADYLEDRCIHQLFEEQTARTPDNVAVVFEEQTLTYQELNARANQLAHDLRSLGVGSETLVAICVGRSLDMVVGILGILKAGGAWLPLDPAHPKDRQQRVFKEARAPVLLTQKSLAAELPEHGAKTVLLDSDGASISKYSKSNPENISTPTNLVYTMYTSGSTGQPKGVMITHASLCHYVGAMRQALGIGPKDIYLHTASFAFSSSVRQLMVPLTLGATAVIAKTDDIRQPLELFETVKRRRVTILDVVPSYWRNCIHALTGLAIQTRTVLLDNHLRLIVSASEPLLADLPPKWTFELGHRAKLVNMFGQTETTGIVATYPIPRSGQVEVKTIPIGGPIADTQIHLLDAQQRPVPVGEVGEIYVGGAGLGRGYLNQPEFTAERFVPNPFGNGWGDRLYKTGDLARCRHDGNIEFLGRVDHQVKIRGIRIEPGEIESALGQHPGVREAVVIAREEVEDAECGSVAAESESADQKSKIENLKSADKRLVAYVVPRGGRAPVTGELLRSFLKGKLPDYMIPSAFVMLSSLPLTPNGKVDRRALPAPDWSRPELESSFVAPRTPVEEALAKIWAEILGLEQVGVHDNFFDLGAHSLMATQVISRVRDAFQVEVSLRTLFETPTVAGMAEHFKTAAGVEKGLRASPLRPIPRTCDIPLSFAQERLWFMHQLDSDSPAYNLPMAVRINGALDIEALGKSLDAIVARHEVLRTTITAADGIPLQVIAKSRSVDLGVIDLSEWPAPERDKELHRLLKEKASLPFKLSSDLMLRATLMRLGEREHVLLLTMHHVVSDGWSMGVLFRELSALYEAFSKGNPSPLSELAIQYADFAVWQREWLQGEVLEEQLSYWRERLAGAPPVLHLPTDRPRPAVQSYRGGRESIELPKDLSEGLKELSRREGVTLFITLLAAFQTLLYRYTGQDDIVVGSPIANRNRAEIEGLIGFFVNTLVLRADVSGNPSFRELLGRVWEVCLGAYAHQDLPFEKLVEELQPERDLSHTPLFQVFFNMVNPGEDRCVKLPGLKAEPFGSHEPMSKFDLTLYVDDQGESLRFSLVYNAGLFDAHTMAQMLGHYRTLLAAVVANPDHAISSISLLTEEERDRFYTQRNVIRATHPFMYFKKEDIDQSIPSRFEQQVEKYPDHIAVRTKSHQWTYRELDRTANRIAQALVRRCGSGEGRVGLLFEHDAPMVAGILGALKAGKTYVPLDPAYPPERLAYMVEDSQAKAILTDDGNIALARTLTDGKLRLIYIEEAQRIGLGTKLEVAVSPDTLAYILYTSGSTGRPKGVMQNHRNVLHHIRNYTNNLHINYDDRLTLLSSYSFDAAVMDIFGALLNGASLHPMDIKEEDPSALFRRVTKEQITIYHSTPTVYRYLSALMSREDLSKIRFVVLGGEEVHKEDVDLFKKIFSPHAIFVNGLGPTESTVTLQYFINHKDPMTSRIVPVGYPVEETELLLLNEAAEEGEVYGEIGIRSAHVALGYWRRPDLTEAAFLPDPEGGTKRIYRTGDMGRLLSDGSIAFIGRKDFQVKVRGIRIELGEIETVLGQHAQVREAVVMARDEVGHGGSGMAEGEAENPKSKIGNLKSSRRLVAYVVPDGGEAPTVDGLRSFLKQKLPEYMVPSAFVFLDALPLAPNGKVDRRALPAPDQSRPELESSFLAPRTPVEEALAKIWAQVLKLEQVGVHDNFFNLGGHSLLAIQVMSRIGKAFGLDLVLRTLFEKPTIAELSSVIMAVKQEEHERFDRLVSEVEALSDEEAARLVARTASKGIQ